MKNSFMVSTHGAAGVAQLKCPICGALCHVSVYSKCEDCCCHYRMVTVAGSKFEFLFQYRCKTIFDYVDLQNKILKLESKKMKKNYARKLNDCNVKEVHSAEWEIVVCDWLSSCGDIQYEVKQNNGKKPDISFVNASGNVVFIADVATVSDDRIEKECPASTLLHELREILRRVAGDEYSFDIRLVSPKKGNLVMFASSRMGANLAKFESWVTANASQVEPGVTLHYKIEENALTITPRIKSKYSVGSYLTRVYELEHIRNNPVFTALDSKSSKQLPEDDNRLVGIFLCDGGCRILNSFQKAWNELPLKDIINNIFFEHRKLDFVISLSLGTAFTINQRPQLKLELFGNGNSTNEKQVMLKSLSRMLEENVSKFSIPEMYPCQSKQEILSKKLKHCYWQFCPEKSNFVLCNPVFE